MRPKVFVTQYQPHLSFAEAEPWGDVVFLTDKEYRPEPVMPQTNERITHEVKKNFAEYLVGIDYIAVTGSSMPNLVVGILIADIHGVHNILKWSGRNRQYELFKLKV